MPPANDVLALVWKIVFLHPKYITYPYASERSWFDHLVQVGGGVVLLHEVCTVHYYCDAGGHCAMKVMNKLTYRVGIPEHLLLPHLTIVTRRRAHDSRVPTPYGTAIQRPHSYHRNLETCRTFLSLDPANEAETPCREWATLTTFSSVWYRYCVGSLPKLMFLAPSHRTFGRLRLRHMTFSSCTNEKTIFIQSITTSRAASSSATATIM